MYKEIIVAVLLIAFAIVMWKARQKYLADKYKLIDEMQLYGVKHPAIIYPTVYAMQQMSYKKLQYVYQRMIKEQEDYEDYIALLLLSNLMDRKEADLKLYRLKALKIRKKNIIAYNGYYNHFRKLKAAYEAKPITMKGKRAKRDKIIKLQAKLTTWTY